MKRPGLALLAAALLGGGVVACGGGGGGDDDDDDTPDAMPGSGTVTPEEGGTVVSDDGLVTLEVPPGAVSEPVTITITNLDEADISAELAADSTRGRVYEFEPDGLTFAVPATVTLVEAPEIVSEIDFAAELTTRVPISRASDGTLELLAGAEITFDPDAASITTTAEMSHFSEVTTVLAFLQLSMSPAEVMRVAPSSWDVTIEASSVATESELSARILSDQGNSNPPTWDLIALTRDGTGIVLPDLDSEEIGSTNAPGEAVVTTRTFRCDEPGQGRYIVSLRFRTSTGTGTFGIITGVSGNAVCTEPAMIAEGAHPTVAGAEAVAQIALDAWNVAAGGAGEPFDDGDLYVAIAGSAGLVVQRLSDGMIVHDFTEGGGQNYEVIGTNNALAAIGPGGTGITTWVPDQDRFSFFMLGNFNSNVTDIAPIPVTAGTSVAGLLAVDNTFDRILRFDPLADGGFMQAADPIIDSADLGPFAGNVVGVFSPPGDGPFLAVTDIQGAGQPSELLWIDPAGPTVTSAGTFPGGGRRIDCVAMGAGFECMATGFPDGVVPISWPDRNATPSFGTPIPTAGPVGVDVALVGGNPMAVHTGFNDGTLHVTDLSMSPPVDTETALTGCPNPGHAIFLEVGGAVSHVLVTCNTMGTYQALPIADVLP